MNHEQLIYTNFEEKGDQIFTGFIPYIFSHLCCYAYANTIATICLSISSFYHHEPFIHPLYIRDLIRILPSKQYPDK